MKIIVLNDPLLPGALTEANMEKIKKTAASVGARVCFAKDEQAVPAGFADAEVVYGYGTHIAATSRDLKWLCVPSAGVDFMMRPDAFANKDCILTNSSGSYGVSIAEHIIAVSLMMMRCLTDFHAETLNGQWGSRRAQRSLKDSRITALGAGDIGGSFAKRVKAFEPKQLTGISHSGKSSEPSFDRVMKTGLLDTILPETDLLVMSLPDTPETRGILSRKRMELLPEGAYIVNVGRGSAIDEDALADLLDSGHLAGAALDVFQTEPLPEDSRLWKTKNLLITPHVAGNLTVEHTLNKNVEMFCEDLVHYAKGEPLTYRVDREKGY
ncbi:MAG: D-2-hydroxyacid dehydrogenase [Lachnospiraceae bacterium]|nr:D-2-hydroxyacid dehydrogenase [Lachnospiraceae bacterium]